MGFMTLTDYLGQDAGSPLVRKVLTELATHYRGLKFELEYPVSGFRIDIAFSSHQVGLELDGARWHNKQKDKLRDEYLEEVEGWKIERVPGWFVHRYPEGTALKALRHIPEAMGYPRYKQAVSRVLSWHLLATANEEYRP